MIKLKNILNEIGIYSIYGGWLTPDNKFEEVDYQAHGSWANDYLVKLGFDTTFEVNTLEKMYAEMYKLGFVRVQFGDDTMFFYYDKKVNPPNDRKIKELKDIAIEFHKSFLEDDVAHRYIEL